MNSKKIKGRDLSLHLAQQNEPSEELDNEDNTLSTLFFLLKIKIFLYTNIIGIEIWCIICSIKSVQMRWIVTREGDSSWELPSISF
jgi:hypothetical protein